MDRREAWRQVSRDVLGLLRDCGACWGAYLRHREFCAEDRGCCEAAMEAFVRRLRHGVRRSSSPGKPRRGGSVAKGT